MTTLGIEFPNPHGTHSNKEAILADFHKSGEDLTQRSRQIATVIRGLMLVISPDARKAAAAEILPYIQEQADVYSDLAAYLREVA